MKLLKGTLTLESKSYPFELEEAYYGNNIFSGVVTTDSDSLGITFNSNTKAIYIKNFKKKLFYLIIVII